MITAILILLISIFYVKYFLKIEEVKKEGFYIEFFGQLTSNVFLVMPESP